MESLDNLKACGGVSALNWNGTHDSVSELVLHLGAIGVSFVEKSGDGEINSIAYCSLCDEAADLVV